MIIRKLAICTNSDISGITDIEAPKATPANDTKDSAANRIKTI
jgi:hypothetical protein